MLDNVKSALLVSSGVVPTQLFVSADVLLTRNGSLTIWLLFFFFFFLLCCLE